MAVHQTSVRVAEVHYWRSVLSRSALCSSTSYPSTHPSKAINGDQGEDHIGHGSDQQTFHKLVGSESPFMDMVTENLEGNFSIKTRYTVDRF